MPPMIKKKPIDDRNAVFRLKTTSMAYMPKITMAKRI
jgi:hypothetical protein